MVVNILVGFVIPWLFGIYLLKKEFKILLFIFPLAAAISFIFNTLGVYFSFWNVHPVLSLGCMSTFPMNIGLFPIIGCYMFFIIKKFSYIPSYIIILSFIIITTFAEWVFVFYMERAFYDNGWNIGWTFVSYLCAYLLLYAYYKAIKRYGVFSLK